MPKNFAYTLEIATRFISKSANHDRLVATRAIETFSSCSSRYLDELKLGADNAAGSRFFEIKLAATEIIRSNALIFRLCFTR